MDEKRVLGTVSGEGDSFGVEILSLSLWVLSFGCVGKLAQW